jgi:acetoin utilization deacetylase AcuC-like enzyme
MVVIHDPRCAGYGMTGHPEGPERVTASAALLRQRHPGWSWVVPEPVADEALLRAHAAEHVQRLRNADYFDADTPAYAGIEGHARRSAGAAIRAAAEALAGRKAFSLMRPPGHHACRNRIMGFCYLNNVAIAALDARARGAAKVAIWDFDAHHGNGTEDIVRKLAGVHYASIHQFPGYPGTGATSFDNIHNFPIPPGRHRQEHRAALEASFEGIRKFAPDLVLVSAGFDAYRGDPITDMDLEAEDFADLGRWIRDSGLKAAAVLEGGYSGTLPELIDGFLSAWDPEP